MHKFYKASQQLTLPVGKHNPSGLQTPGPCSSSTPCPLDRSQSSNINLAYLHSPIGGYHPAPRHFNPLTHHLQAPRFPVPKARVCSSVPSRAKGSGVCLAVCNPVRMTSATRKVPQLENYICTRVSACSLTAGAIRIPFVRPSESGPFGGLGLVLAFILCLGQPTLPREGGGGRRAVI
jgi:hypothetical protein